VTATADPGALPPGAPPLVFVDDLDDPRLDPDDRHHLERVLRVRPGDEITVSDGRGSWRPCRLAAQVEVVGPVVSTPAPAPDLTVAFALVKGERPELIVQKLTELGVDRIVAFASARSVVRWEPDRAARNIERLRRVAREAAMQSRRCRLPEIAPLASFADVIALPGAAACDRFGAAPSLAHPTLLVGPEGGWDDDERRRLPAVVGLGAQVLRADTAAIAAGVMLGALRDGLIAPAAR